MLHEASDISVCVCTRICYRRCLGASRFASALAAPLWSAAGPWTRPRFGTTDSWHSARGLVRRARAAVGRESTDRDGCSVVGHRYPVHCALWVGRLARPGGSIGRIVLRTAPRASYMPQLWSFGADRAERDRHPRRAPARHLSWLGAAAGRRRVAVTARVGGYRGRLRGGFGGHCRAARGASGAGRGRADTRTRKADLRFCVCVCGATFSTGPPISSASGALPGVNHVTCGAGPSTAPAGP